MVIGCTSTQPMTQKIELQASAVGDVKDFQYYISRELVLVKTEDPIISGRVSNVGQIDVIHTKSVIQITPSTEGELLNTEIDDEGYTIYYVAFEVENDNCLRFKQRGPGREEKIYLVYDDEETYALNYGGAVYVIDWENKGIQATADNLFGQVKGKMKGVTTDNVDHPYLLVKMNEKVTEKENYRKASGRKVGG
jgi:hypothetical protein